jgi:single-strand DNA-binding protein
MKVGVCGQIQTRSYDDKDGNKRYITEVIADEVEFISYPKTECAEPKQAPKIGSKKSVQDLKPIEDDGLPF